MTIPSMESAKIITLSTAHLHPQTRRSIERCNGDMIEGPSIAVRPEGFLVHSHLNHEDALDADLQGGLALSLQDRHPDLVLIRALARGLKAEWINFDVDGIECSDILPVYDDGGSVELPSDEIWRKALSDIVPLAIPTEHAVKASREVLEMLEAGQTPDLHDALEMDPLPH